MFRDPGPVAEHASGKEWIGLGLDLDVHEKQSVGAVAGVDAGEFVGVTGAGVGIAEEGLELGVEEDGIDGGIDDSGDVGEGEAEKVVEMTFEGVFPRLIKVDGFVHGAPGSGEDVGAN
jgi:hypothetical protein